MFSRILFLAVCLIWAPAAVAQPATVVLNFYVYDPSVYFSIMQSKGLVATYFNDPLRPGVSATKSQLVAMKAAGWEIGLYGIGPADENFLTMYAANPVVANDRIKAGVDAMWALGFPVTTLSPTQRAWSAPLAAIAKNSVSSVLAYDIIGSVWQSCPIPDPLYVRYTGSASVAWPMTATSLNASVDSVPPGSLALYGVHQVGSTVGDLYTLPTPEFEGWTTHLQSLVAAGTIRVVTYADAISKWCH